MTAKQHESALQRIKRDIIAATIADDGERLRELSQEKQKLKRKKFCSVCGEPTQGFRCFTHALARHHRRALQPCLTQSI
jgi:ribosomal protein S14